MDTRQFSDSFILAHREYFPSNALMLVQEKLQTLPESQQASVQAISFKNPIVVLILSIFFGAFGVDRFYLGDVLLGVLKLITLGGFGVWALVDIYFCFVKSKQINLDKLQSVIR